MNIRQQALATAEIYLKRFYTKVSIRESNIYLMVATSVYLACKMEECPQHIRTIVSESKTIFQGEHYFYFKSNLCTIMHETNRTKTNRLYQYRYD